MPQTIICTTVPAGVHNGRLTVSLLFSPRLTPAVAGKPTTLAEFPDFLDWPSVLSKLTFPVSLRGSARQLTATRIDLTSENTPDSVAWKSIFLPTSPVFGDSPTDYSAAQVQTPQLARNHETIRTVYGGKDMSSPAPAPANLNPAAASSDLSSLSFHGLAAEVLSSSLALRSLAPTSDQNTSAHASVDAQLQANSHVPHASSNPIEAFIQLLRFLVPFKTPKQPPAPSSKDYDFQRAFSGLLEYPGLMRRLGLIADFSLNAAPDDLTPTELTGFVQIVPSRNPAWDAGVHALWTAYAVEQVSGNPGYTFFLPRTRDSSDPYSHGFLRMNPNTGNKPWEAVNIDVENGTLNLSTFAQQLDSNTDPQNLPALRTGPLALIETEIAKRVVDSIASNKARETVLASASPSAPPAASSVEVYAHDLVRGYCWDVNPEARGWSSICRRSLKFVAQTPQSATLNWTPAQPDEAAASVGAASEVPDDPKKPPDQLNVSHSVLRWGGWGLGSTRPGKAVGDDGKPVTPESLFCPDFPLRATAKAFKGRTPRLRIGGSYAIRGRLAYLTGPSFSPEEADRALALVNDKQIAYPPFSYKRFDPIGHPAFVPTQAEQPGDGLFTLVIREHGNDTPSAEWHVVPPLMSEEMAELHGVFDGLSAGDALDQIKRHEGNLPAGYDPRFLRRERLDNGFRIRIPYLPDPLCRGVIFRNLPSSPGPVSMTFGTEKYRPPVRYPNRYAETFRIQLKSGTRPPQHKEGEPLLTIEIPRGESYEVPFNSYLWQQDLKLMGLLDWIAEAPDSPLGKAVKLIQAAEKGKGDRNPCLDYWFLTPVATMHLIHAVRKPVGPLTIRSLTAADRTPGSKNVGLTPDVAFHRPSTAELRIHAAWTDSADIPGQSDFVSHEEHADLAPITVPADPAAHDFFTTSFAHIFNDTKYHHVIYTMKGISRYTSYYDPRVSADPDNVSILSNAFPVEVLSTQPPAAPGILYAIPTFGWEKPAKEKKQITRTMTGRGVRIYLERGWFSSGNGELLGVVFARDRFDRLALPLQRLVTQWGIDPVWPSLLPLDFPKLGSCIAPKAVRENINLAVPKENSGPALLQPLPNSIPVDVAGFSVGVDKENDRLWCDIAFDTGFVYRPFVRMALCRFQPNSIKDAWISSVVQADFVQLASDRVITITEGPGKHQKTVTVTGPHALNADTRAEMVATLELRRHGLPETLSYGSTIVCEQPLSALKDALRGWTWSGTLNIPKECWFHKFRLTVREYEHYETDIEGDPGNVRPAKRQVFFDAIEF